MDNIIVITQNVKLPSLAGLKGRLVEGDILVVSTQFVFENAFAIAETTFVFRENPFLAR